MLSASKRIVVYAGLLATPLATNFGQIAPVPNHETVDLRLARLRQFLIEKDCPINKYAADFIEAADKNDLDWRLLPSISYIESGGGKEYKNNNVLGWDSCRERFPSVRAGIHYVASRLSNSQLYRQKSLDEKLRVYNPQLEYSGKVKAVMRLISRTEIPVFSLN